MTKMGNKMVALCTAAIGAIYVSGFVVTMPTQAENAMNQPTIAENQTTSNLSATQQQVQTTKKVS
ncbi:hypothetical protein [Tepidibacillus marianensis]|uniref:hypothetical protein n=1 Tax=Tepidibacillus marianensis TaxID=3131995 RepID=UPI0030CC5D4C